MFLETDPDCSGIGCGSTVALGVNSAKKGVDTAIRGTKAVAWGLRFAKCVRDIFDVALLIMAVST